MRPADVLTALVAADPARPRLTWYDDDTGERIELSAKVLRTWVAKAATLLLDDAGLAAGDTLLLDLPGHWRAGYWALSSWWVGAHVVVVPSSAAGRSLLPRLDPDVVVTTDPHLASAARYAVLVSLPMLARRHPDLPDGVVDEAAELAGYPDHPPPAAVIDGAALALTEYPVGAGEPGAPVTTTYRDLVAPHDAAGPLRVRISPTLSQLLRQALSVWAAGGSVVVVSRPSLEQADRLTAEGVTADWSDSGPH